MRHALYLALRYLAHHRLTTAVLVVSMALLLFVPAATALLVRHAEQELTGRAAATPLVIGPRGSPVDLVLRALYFQRDGSATLPYREVTRVRASGLAEAIPLHVRFHSEDDPIVGTSLDYFPFRGLRVEDGSLFLNLGDCVLGASVAERRGLGVGDRVTSAPEGVFDLAGVYPLRMRVVGVLAPTGSPDDRAIFVDLRTAWVIQGLAHGHAGGEGDHAGPGEPGGDDVDVKTFNEVTPENAHLFHFHGDQATYPLSAILPVPPSEREATLLRGRYLGAEESQQILEPRRVVDGLMDTVFRVRSLVLLGTLLIGVAAAATMALVLVLSWRLRRGQIETLGKIGASRGRIATVLGAEVVLVLLAAMALAALLTWWASLAGTALLRSALG